MLRRLYLTGIPVYIFLLVLSILFYKERTVFNDAAFNLFYIVKDGSFCFPSFRFGEAFTQIFPLVGRLFNASLEDILILYSSGFIIYYFICYFIAGTVLKQYGFALSILLFHLLFTSESFYYIPSGVVQGTSALLVIFAFIARYGKLQKTSTIAIMFSMAVLAAFFHPLMAFAVGYSVIFFLLDKEQALRRKQLIRFGITFIAALLLKALVLRLPYETHALGGLRNFVTRFPDYFNLYAHRRFLRNCFTEYYWIPLLFLLILIFYLTRRERIKAIFFTVSVIGYYFLVSISYPDADTPAFYMENTYMPLALFLVLPLCFDVTLHKRLFLYLFTAIVATGSLRIFFMHEKYTARLNWERNFMHTHAGVKLIYPAALVPIDTVWATWGTPYEFWLLSTVENKATASIVIDPKPRERGWAAWLSKSLVVNWNVFAYKELNPKYFILTDTTSSYLIDSAQ